MIDLLKHKLIALFAVLSVFTVFGFAASKPVAADISYGGAEWTSVNANVNAVTPFTLIINQAMFVYNPGNAQQNNWLNAAGVHAHRGNSLLCSGVSIKLMANGNPNPCHI